MCGLAGCLQLDGRPPDRALVARMTERLRHRGPDSEGAFTDDRVGFGFRRLRIIDLERGDQPIGNEDGSIVMMCNGEIFNYQELRRELVARGHCFKSRTDVEVLVHLYEEDGVGLFDRIEGQYALVIYDRPKRSLLLARDPFGVVPLYYTTVDGALLFASEIKALLEHPGVRRDVDLTALDQVFTFPGLVSPRTILKDVHSVMCGQYLTVRDGRIEARQYWDLHYPLLDEPMERRPEGEYVEQARALLTRSVERRLQSDVPVGYYLSGGLDSSLIGALLAQLRPAAPPTAFSIAFHETHMNEAPYQQLLRAHIATPHVSILFDPSEIAARLQKMVYHSECPVKESYNTCSLALSEAVKARHVSVVLSGEGADELFAGYIGYRFDRVARQSPSRLEHALESEYRRLLWGVPDLFYEKDYYAFRETKQALYSEAVRERFEEIDCAQHDPVDKARLIGRDRMHQRSYLDFKLRLCDHLVSDHGDRMALANAVEARYPFLDREIARFAASVPSDLKVNGLTEKYLLRKVAEPLLPRAIIERQKFGFHAPGSPALLRAALPWVEHLLSPDRLRAQGYFDAEAVTRLRATYADPGFHLAIPFEDDLLMVVLTFQMLVDTFGLNSLN